MKKQLLTYLKFGLFLAFGGLLLYLAVRGQDIDKIKEAFRQANYSWVALSMLLGVISHISRTIRWNMLIRPLGYKPKFYNTFFAVMIGYFANIAFPRLGEVSKCGILNKYEKIPVNKLLGTMIVERSMDLLSLIAVFVFLIIFQFGKLSSFLDEYIFSPLYSKVTGNWLFLVAFVLGLLLLLLLVIIFFNRIKRFPFYIKVSELIIGMWQGIKSVRDIQNKGAFIFHSIFIWVMYFAMTYVVFFALDGTAELGFWAALAVFVMGSIGMVAPAPGGLGPYHFMASETLILYGVVGEVAVAFAFIIHTAQTVMIIIAGFLSLILLPALNSKSADEPFNMGVDPAESR